LAYLSFAKVFTFLLPEVKGRDPDVVLADEIRVRREERKAQSQDVKET